MKQQQNSSFGNVVFANNTGGKQNGSENSGFVIDCVNLDLYVSKSTLDIRQSNDIQSTGTENELTCESTSKAKINGSKNKIEFSRIDNAKHFGSDNEIRATLSQNLDFLSYDCKILVSSVKNCKLDVVAMNIRLSNSSNILVDGNKGDVKIADAHNQTVTRVASAGEGLQNLITFTKVEDDASISVATDENWRKSLKVSTTYDRDVSISGQDSYTLDGVSFGIALEEGEVFEVMMNFGQDLDAGSVRQTLLGPTEIEIFATKNGEKHVLTFKAPQIMQQSELISHGFKFCLSSGHSGKL